MFSLNGTAVKKLMQRNGIDATELARRAELDEDFIKKATEFYGHEMKVRDFEPLARLGRVLGVSPFELI